MDSPNPDFVSLAERVMQLREESSFLKEQIAVAKKEFDELLEQLVSAQYAMYQRARRLRPIRLTSAQSLARDRRWRTLRHGRPLSASEWVNKLGLRAKYGFH